MICLLPALAFPLRSLALVLRAKHGAKISQRPTTTDVGIGLEGERRDRASVVDVPDLAVVDPRHFDGQMFFQVVSQFVSCVTKQLPCRAAGLLIFDCSPDRFFDRVAEPIRQSMTLISFLFSPISSMLFDVGVLILLPAAIDRRSIIGVSCPSLASTRKYARASARVAFSAIFVNARLAPRPKPVRASVVRAKLAQRSSSTASCASLGLGHHRQT